jgi:hypothetical protein
MRCRGGLILHRETAPHRRMKITVQIDEDPLAREINIIADAEGLEYLAGVCARLIGKSGPAAHWHLSNDMGTLMQGSIDTTIAFEQID